MLLQRILRQHSVALCRAQSTPLRRYTSSFLRPSSPATPQPPTTRRTPAPSSTTSTPQALLAYYSQVPTRGVTLPELSRYGLPPLDQDVLLASAEHTRVELLAGLARRVSINIRAAEGRRGPMRRETVGWGWDCDVRAHEMCC